MKTFTHAAGLTVLAALLSFAAPGGAANAQEAVYRFPGDGVRNANRQIGPFCCTGETATVTSLAGETVGYVYFYGFAGGRNIGPNRSTATSVDILLSAVPPGGAPIVSRASFNAAGWRPGSSRTVRVGQLTFVVTLQGTIDTSAGDSAFDMQTVRALVRVSGAG